MCFFYQDSTYDLSKSIHYISAGFWRIDGDDYDLYVANNDWLPPIYDIWDNLALGKFMIKLNCVSDLPPPAYVTTTEDPDNTQNVNQDIESSVQNFFGSVGFYVTMSCLLIILCCCIILYKVWMISATGKPSFYVMLHLFYFSVFLFCFISMCV